MISRWCAVAGTILQNVKGIVIVAGLTQQQFRVLICTPDGMEHGGIDGSQPAINRAEAIQRTDNSEHNHSKREVAHRAEKRIHGTSSQEKRTNSPIRQNFAAIAAADRSPVPSRYTLGDKPH
jgi:hypothetical protein